jgi:hypothetical protein
MIILAVDPQKDKSALAVFTLQLKPPKYELTRLIMVGPGILEAYDAIFDPVMFLQDSWALFVEGQFFHRKNNNPATLISLVEARRDWQNAAEIMGDRGWGGICEVVPPSTWQRAMLGGGSRETLFRRAQVVFRDRFGDGWGRTNEHMRDAALIGAWACERILWEMRQEKA